MNRTKYYAKKVIVDGIKFDSMKEANRYRFLKELEKKREIQNLQLQVKFPLIPPMYEDVVTYTTKTHKQKIKRKRIESGVTYIADFVYMKNGEKIVEDVKGYRKGTAYSIFAIKRKLMLYLLGIKVDEV